MFLFILYISSLFLLKYIKTILITYKGISLKSKRMNKNDFKSGKVSASTGIVLKLEYVKPLQLCVKNIWT